MSTVLLRTLTKKSKFGWGKYPDITIEELLLRHKFEFLLQVYYGTELINYDEEIKHELGIVGEFVIDKPGRDWDKQKEWVDYLTERCYKNRGLRPPPKIRDKRGPICDNVAIREMNRREARENSKILNMARVQRLKK